MRGFLIICLLAFCPVFSFAQNTVTVEPPFWWEGMVYNKLELLVHGKNISALQPKIISGSVTLNAVVRPESPNYLILQVEINNQASGGFQIELTDKKGKTSSSYWFELKKRAENSAQRKGFNSSDAVYLILPDRFANADTTNDSRPELIEKANRSKSLGRHGGDIKGITQNLGYISSLGFTAVWLNPVQENNQNASTYHGYAITDFYAIDARLGSNSDYLEFVEECHKKGLKVIMDMVFNHCGTNNKLANDPPSPDWFNQWPEFTRPNYKGEVISDPYASDYDKIKMNNGWFDVTMADFNQKNPHVLNYLTQNSIWWIEYAGLNGIRMDTYPYPDKDAMAVWAKTVMAEYPYFNIVGESWLSLPSHTAFWQQNPKLPAGENTNLKSVTDFPLYYSVIQALNEPDGWFEGWSRIYNILSQDFLYPDPQSLLIFPDNHDIERFATSIGADFAKYKLGMVFYATTRGIPQFYYGTELMMESTPYSDHGSYRRDYPGGWPGDSINAFLSFGLSQHQIMARDFLKEILLWRKDKEVVHTGKLKHFLPENNVYVYCRYNANETIMVVLNKNTETTRLNLNRFNECLSGFAMGYDILSKKEFELKGSLLLEPLTPIILELKK
ncbi:MAG: glycoside hydrolase family 13 protein [Bacteroidales bacterium]|nr:glycoside hydrolase family 13 protein [Bacteroidales bacterium]